MRRPVGMMLAAFAVVMTVPGAPVHADADDVPLATRLAAKTHPAVQLLQTRVTADVVVPYPKFDQKNLDALLEDVTQDALDGQIPSDNRSLVKTAISRMLGDVGKYLKPTGEDRVINAESTVLCTGWWVTPDGHMITAAHCVSPDQKATAAAFAEQAQEDLGADDEAIVDAILDGVDADDELKDKTEELVTKFNTENLKLRDLQEVTSVQLTQPGGGVDAARSLTAEVVTEGEAYPGKDVALIKVSGQQNLPTLELGADADIAVGRNVYIDGFPGTVTNEESLSASSRLQPAFTQGPVNAQRTTQQGVPYFQTQAPAYGGNSGGPVVSDSGKVVGILIAQLADEDVGVAQNEQLVLPVSVVTEKLNERGIRPAASPVTVRYNEALDLFYKKHYKKALPKFREVQNLAPGHPYVAKYISDSQSSITAGKDETPMATSTRLAIGGGATAAVLLLAGLMVGLLMISRRRRTPQPTMPWGPPPGPPPGQPFPMGQGFPPPPGSPLPGSPPLGGPPSGTPAPGNPLPGNPPPPQGPPLRYGPPPPDTPPPGGDDAMPPPG